MTLKYKNSSFVSQAKQAIDMMMYAHNLKDVTFAGQILDTCVMLVLKNAGSFDKAVSEMRTIVTTSLACIPNDGLYDIRALILQRNANRLM